MQQHADSSNEPNATPEVQPGAFSLGSAMPATGQVVVDWACSSSNAWPTGSILDDPTSSVAEPWPGLDKAALAHDADDLDLASSWLVNAIE